MQEWDAQHFVLYAAIPHHMLQFIDVDDPYVIDQMVHLFKVTDDLCFKQLEQIQNRRMNRIAETTYTYKV
ncbi:hypothetical protein ACIQD3_04430 [Peribacillus loiseleuriae]|uniref:hypothetical protein n=1 Tax=Peribacillus loiseleuriae TaxID=1679170 RepID=UPI0038174AF5